LVVGTLTDDGGLSAVTFGTARRGLDGLLPQYQMSQMLQLNVTAHPSTASVPTSYYLMWRFIFALYTVNESFVCTNAARDNEPE